MKKMFLAAITALALCSYSYAQDDYEDEYEEDAPAREEAAPAVEEAEEDEAPAPAPAAKPAKKAKKSDGSAFLGIGMGLTSNFADKGLKEIACTTMAKPRPKTRPQQEPSPLTQATTTPDLQSVPASTISCRCRSCRPQQALT